MSVTTLAGALIVAGVPAMLGISDAMLVAMLTIAGVVATFVRAVWQAWSSAKSNRAKVADTIDAIERLVTAAEVTQALAVIDRASGSRLSELDRVRVMRTLEALRTAMADDDRTPVDDGHHLTASAPASTSDTTPNK